MSKLWPEVRPLCGNDAGSGDSGCCGVSAEPQGCVKNDTPPVGSAAWFERGIRDLLATAQSDLGSRTKPAAAESLHADATALHEPPSRIVEREHRVAERAPMFDDAIGQSVVRAAQPISDAAIARMLRSLRAVREANERHVDDIHRGSAAAPIAKPAPADKAQDDPAKPATEVGSLDAFAEKRLDERDDLALRLLRGETLSPHEADRLLVLNAALYRLLPKPTPLSPDVEMAIEDAHRLLRSTPVEPTASPRGSHSPTTEPVQFTLRGPSMSSVYRSIAALRRAESWTHHEGPWEPAPAVATGTVHVPTIPGVDGAIKFSVSEAEPAAAAASDDDTQAGSRGLSLDEAIRLYPAATQAAGMGLLVAAKASLGLFESVQTTSNLDDPQVRRWASLDDGSRVAYRHLVQRFDGAPLGNVLSEFQPETTFALAWRHAPLFEVLARRLVLAIANGELVEPVAAPAASPVAPPSEPSASAEHKPVDAAPAEMSARDRLWVAAFVVACDSSAHESTACAFADDVAERFAEKSNATRSHVTALFGRAIGGAS